jgi:hypothetical protein
LKIYLENHNTGGYKKAGAALKIIEIKSYLKLNYFYDKNNLEIVCAQIILNKFNKLNKS